MIIIITLFLVYCVICFIYGMAQYIRNPKPPNGLTLTEYRQYYYNREWQRDDNEDETEVESVHKQERIQLLDETIVKYNKLLDNLTEQYNFTSDDKKRAAILSKQIIALEKLNKALEKREKIE